MGFQSNINRMMSSVAGGIMGVKHTLEKRNELLDRQKQAQKKTEQVKEAKTKQKATRRNFMIDYLSKQETSLGGTVGELPIAMQKQIASQYTKSQRKTMMDRMDREAKTNGK